MLRVLLIRHGECEMNLNLADYIGGQSNASPLTPKGIQQAQLLGKQLQQAFRQRGIDPAHCGFYSSTAVRAYKTAQIAIEQMSISDRAIPTIVSSDELLELNMGDWEGGLRKECYTPENLAKIVADTLHFKPPNGESQKNVEDRMAAYLKEVILPNTKPSHPSIIFGHGMAFKCLLRHILESNPSRTRNIALHNTSITEIGVNLRRKSPNEPDFDTWHILRVNDVGHLMEDLEWKPV